jgi:3-hydroxyacyl-CoA dehydrogenase
LSRQIVPFIDQAFFALEEKVAKEEEIDKACRVGLEVVLAVMWVLHKELGEKYRPAPLPHISSQPRAKPETKSQDVLEYGPVSPNMSLR